MVTSQGWPAVEMRDVSKRYRLGGLPTATTLRDSVTTGLTRVLGRGGEEQRAPQEVWALRDVSLAITEGTSLGIVGRNGSGKSTLLKVLARITEPTRGVSRTRGTVVSLLEVGTGFHPELSGRENIFLNGAILGMSRRMVERRLDEIVDFAGIGRFLDTPVKRYSSGMYLRLAFAVAAHVQADVLLVDEVLAVGDAEFQRRCLGVMEDLRHSGRTVVFVSHNLDAVTRLCSSALWLDAGRVQAVGPTAEVVNAYLTQGTPDAGVRAFPDDPTRAVALRSLRLRPADGRLTGRIARNVPFTVDLELLVRESLPGLDLAVSVETLGGIRLLDEALSDTSHTSAVVALGQRGDHLVSLTLPPLLMPGEYSVNVWVGTPYETLVWEHDAGRLRLEGSHQARPDRLLFTAGSWGVTAGRR